MAGSQVYGNILSTFSAGVDVLNLPNIFENIASSVRSISEQRQSGKKKCEDLQLDAITLRRMIQSPDRIDTSSDVSVLEDLMSKIDHCLSRFAKKNWLDDTVEALFRKEYLQLRNEYRQLEEKYILVFMDDIKNNLNQTTSLWQKVLESSKTATSLHSPVNLTIDASSITWEGSIGKGKAANLGDIECRRLDYNLTSRKALQIYQDLQRGAHVQRIHGIADINKQEYVVMQDCSKLITLKSWRGDSSRALALTDRVRIAFDVAQSVAWLHEGGLLLKYLSESSICLENTGNSHQRPVLTQLRYARCLLERTNSLRIDVRYEAPENLTELFKSSRNLKPHSHATDIWSLGIVIWQILTDGAPYQLENEMLLLDEIEELSTLRPHLERSPMPGQIPSGLPTPLVELIQNCWSPISYGRPSAKSVAGCLLRTLAVLDLPVVPQISSTVDETSIPEELPKAESAAFELIEQARKKSSNRKELAHQHEKAIELSEGDFAVLFRYAGHPLHHECAFLVGALIWWDLVNHRWIDDTFTPRALGWDGRRAEHALLYLLMASDGGNTRANFEIAHAYAALKRDYESRINIVRD